MSLRDLPFSRREKVGPEARALSASSDARSVAELEHRIVAQAVGVIAVGTAAGDPEDALAQPLDKAVVDVGRMPAILNGRGHTFDQAGLRIHPAQDQGVKVTGNRAACEVGADRKTGDGGKSQLSRDRSVHRRSRLSFGGGVF